MTSNEEFTHRAERLIERLSAEPLGPEIEEDKAYVIQELQRMIRHVQEGKLPTRPERMPHLARLVVDQWPLGDELANEVGEVEALYRKL